MVPASFLAPIHDYSDLAFRMLCQKYGAESACVPLVNATAIARSPAKLAMVDAHPDERNVGVQMVGDDPDAMGKAAGIITDAKGFVSWLNINCGCPSVRTVDSGGGSALLDRPEKIVAAIVAIRKRTDTQLSVKLRIKNGLAETAGICRMIEEAGVDFIIIHGRTPGQGYSGKADWEMIKTLKERMGVPVIGNGDIRSADEGRTRVSEGYCNGYMIGRAAMANPMVFQDTVPESIGERFGLLGEYISLQKKYLGEPRIADVKLKAFNLTRGLPDAGAMRDRIGKAKTIEEIVGENKGQLSQ